MNEKIIIDYREKNSLIASILIKNGLKIEFRELKIGDYLVKDTIIERKTIEDFLASMLNKRLISQLESLKELKNKILLIEGFEEKDIYTERQISPNAIRGFLISILLKDKVPIIFTKNPEDSAKFIEIIFKKQEKSISLRENKKTKDLKERVEYILEGFPGIGPKTAKKLIENFGSLKKIINAPEEDLKKVLGKKYEGFKKIVEKEIV